MQVIKGSTKRGMELRRYASRHNEGTELSDVYTNWSAEKGRAMKDCKRWCDEDNGFDFHIVSHNTFQFTVSWNYPDPETGEIMTRIETANNTYIITGDIRPGEENNVW